MSLLFTPMTLGNQIIKNRFVHSATYEAMAKETGEVSENLIRRYNTLSKGGIGLIIPGMMLVQSSGRGYAHQVGIHNNKMIPGLKTLVSAAHEHESKIVFQLAHAGRQTTKAMIGMRPMGPSVTSRDPVNFVKPRAMSEADIQETIHAFGKAAWRAAEAGADGVQIHAAHGYLVNQFLSPFHNNRHDEWGGSDVNRFKFLKQILLEIKKHVPDNFMILVKLNTHDHTPKAGITPDLAATYAGFLSKMKIHGLEVSCGSILYSFMNMCRGNVPVDELVQGLPFWKRPLARIMINRFSGKFDLEEGYNLEVAALIKPKLENIPLFVVGGFRRFSHMASVIQNGLAEGISLSRPFIREPLLLKKFKDGRTSDEVSCVSCNRCLAAIANDLPVRCYRDQFP